MNKKVIEWPDKILRSDNELVDNVDEIQQLIKDLIDTCNVAMGAGLAAPQIGVNKQVVVIKPAVFGKENPDPSSYNDAFMVLINPVLSNQGNAIEWKEACLSIPGVEGKVSRSEITMVKYIDENGKEKRLLAEWPFSGGLQHECDHLEGKLYFHRMGKKKGAWFLDRWRRKKRKERIKAKRAKRASR